MRFGAEITKDVAPPFQFYIKTQGKDAVSMQFDNTDVIDADYFVRKLAKE